MFIARAVIRAIVLLSIWPSTAWVGEAMPDYDRLRQEFVDPDHAHWGEVPLWWWEGEPMRREKVTWQLETLAKQGVCAICPIQRSPGRCNPPSFSPEWWEMFTFVAGECKRLGMRLWAYDQVGYGHYGWLEKAAAKAGDRRTRRLAIRTAETADGRPAHIDFPPGDLLGARAYPLNGGQADDAKSIDLASRVTDRELNWNPPPGAWRIVALAAVPEQLFHLSDQACDAFIDMLYGEVERRLGKEAMGTTFAGMFQDEHPPTPRDIVTDRLIDSFVQQHGYPLERAVAALHFDVGRRTPKYRVDFFDAYLALDEACYWKRVYDWTAQRGLLTSHDNWGRRNIVRQSQGYIDYFRTQRWFSAPGYDDAGIRPIRQRNYYDTKIAASIARLYRRPRVWSEAFHSSGWGRTTNQTLTWLTTNYVFGANLYDEHGLYYSVRAGTWEHAAPDPHWRQPYWCYYHHLSDWVARMSYLMAQGSHVVDVAVHYPVVSLLAGPPPNTKPLDYNRYMSLSRAIFDAGIDNDIIDDDSILRAKIKDGRLWVAGNGYQALVFGPERTVRLSVLRKALEFAAGGGTVLFSGTCPSASVESGRDDPRVAAALRGLIGDATANGGPRQPGGKQHPQGGYGGWVPEAPARVARTVGGRIERDFTPDRGAFYVAHRRVGPVDIYLVQNVDEAKIDLAADFRAAGVVERWDPTDGRVLPVDAFRRDGNKTRVWQRIEGNAAHLFVFHPGDTPGIAAASVPRPPVTRERKLAEQWQFSVIPTRDNRWGDYRWPPSKTKIGPEIRSFRYREEIATPGTELGWHKADLDDRCWQQARYSIGPFWLQLVDVPQGPDVAKQVLQSRAEIRAGAQTRVEGATCTWRPVAFSQTIGLGKPMPWGGHSGYPDGAIDQNFIELEAGHKFLFTRIRSPRTQRLGLRVALRNSSARLWVAGVQQPFEGAVGNLPLSEGENDVLLELPDGGRGMLYVQAQPPTVETLAEAARARISPDLARAHWIRDPSAGAGYVRRSFHLEDAPEEARLIVTAYTGYRLWINGHHVEEDIGPWAKWTHPESANVTRLLHKGENVIAAWIQVYEGQNVHAESDKKGLALALEGRYKDGRAWRVVSDPSWKGTTDEQSGWEQPGFDATNWPPVEVLSRVGAPPWGRAPLENAGKVTEPRRPLAIDLASPYLTCFDEAPEIVYDVKATEDRRVGWYRFVAPPGLKQLRLGTTAPAQVWVGGQPASVRQGVATVAQPHAGVSQVAIRLEMRPGAYGGAAFPIPIGVTLAGGTIGTGRWSEYGLPTYAGIGVYTQNVEWTGEAHTGSILLDLGEVLVAAEVRVNGHSAGVRLARPFTFDVTNLIQPGNNTIEVRVANTIAPHYTVTNQVANLGPTDSGLIGPVVLRTIEAPAGAGAP